MSYLILLDNETVQALADPTHPKHRRVLHHVQASTIRRRQMLDVSVAVPTSVRVEAGWDRTSPRSALLNQVRVADL